MGTELDRLAAERYVLLTTFRKNGTGVPTPVWAARDGDALVVWSARKAGKVKRIRNNGKAEVTACDARGKRTHGATVSGTARLLDDEASQQTRDTIKQKYGLVGQVSMFFSELRGKDRTIGIAIELEET